MEIDFDNLIKLIGQLGVAVALAVVLWYAVFVPRKRKIKGVEEEVQVSLLVPGWLYAKSLTDIEELRAMYVRMIHDEQERAELRVAEWRGFRDEEKIRRIDAENDTKKLVSLVENLGADVAFLVEVQRITTGTEPRRGARRG